MADPQDGLKAWLTECLRWRGPGSCRELAERLGLPPGAVSRMKNMDGGREQRSIEAHLIPSMAEFFGEWPPGYGPMENKKSADDLVAKAEKAGKRKAGTSRKTEQSATKDVVVQGVAGPVTVIDKSVNVLGDDATTVAGNAPAPLADGAAELMGAVNEAIDEIYRSLKKKLTLADLGRLALERHAAIMAACQDPEEYPHALAIMKLRLRRELRERGRD